MNYRILFCRYVLPYLLYLDALQPPAKLEKVDPGHDEIDKIVGGIADDYNDSFVLETEAETLA